VAVDRQRGADAVVQHLEELRGGEEGERREPVGIAHAAARQAPDAQRQQQQRRAFEPDQQALVGLAMHGLRGEADERRDRARQQAERKSARRDPARPEPLGEEDQPGDGARTADGDAAEPPHARARHQRTQHAERSADDRGTEEGPPRELPVALRQARRPVPARDGGDEREQGHEDARPEAAFGGRHRQRHRLHRQQPHRARQQHGREHGEQAAGGQLGRHRSFGEAVHSEQSRRRAALPHPS